MIPHQGACNLANAQERTFGLGPNDRMLQFASISFDASIFEIIMGLQVGAAMVLAPQDDLLPGEPLLNVLKRHEVTAVTLPPTALTQLPASELPSLHTITVAGEACPPELVERWAINRRFFNLYGPTESTVWASYQPCEPGKQVTIGRPVSNARLYILDEYQQPVPIGVAGELCIGGAGLADGYLNRVELTAEKFLIDPFVAGERIYRSGDLVRFLPDGNIEFLGRIDHQVKVRGFRIELGEIETTLSAHEGIREVIVLARGDSIKDQKLVAYVVPHEGKELSLSDLRAWLKQSLPEFMIPGAFVVLDAFPLTPNGKVDRKALPSPDQQSMSLEVDYVAPRTPEEQTLTDIWVSLLNVERVGINDNFFELGGDSILSIQIIARAAQAGLRLTPKQLFQHQTVAELAAVAGSELIAAEQETLIGTVPLTPIQQWFVQRKPTNPQHFNQSMLLESDATLDANVIEQALHALLMQHDALRLRLTEAPDGWQQHMAEPSAEQLLQVVDLAGMNGEQEDKLHLESAEALQASFNLASGPLLRAILFRRDDEQADQLLIAIHHIAVDWVSWNILQEDLQSAYSLILANETVKLPAKTSSFRAWSEHLNLHAQAPELQQELSYWQGQPWRDASRLPLDHADGQNVESSTSDVTVELPEELTTYLLQELPKAWRSRINEALLTALLRAVNAWTGGDTLSINLEGHGREELFDDIDLSRTVGWFTSLYPALLQTTTDSTPGQTLQAVKQSLHAIPNKGIGFGILRYLSDTANELASIDAPQLGFNYLGQIDQPTDSDRLLRAASGYRGHEQSPAATRPHTLDVHSVVTGGRLQVSLIYSENLYAQATIEQLASQVLDELVALVEYCRGNTPTIYTPADFPLARLSQTELDNALPADVAIENVSHVTPLQHGMLFHSLFAGDKDVYFARFAWRLAGTIDRTAFANAWQQVTNRHTSLRTSFSWEGSDEPVQIVRAEQQAELEHSDWSDLSADQQDRQLADLLDSDQRTRFDFTQSPLLRLRLIKLGEQDHRFIWSFHHAILDGWSVPLVLKEVFAIYDATRAGLVADLPEPQPFARYIEWLDNQSATKAEQFWHDLLAGFSSPTPLPAATDVVLPTSESEFAELQTRLDAETVRRLRDIAQQQRITLNTLVQGMWALLLSRYSGEEDIVFGATTSGRPASMPGVEAMIGLFLNTLPLRVAVDQDSELLNWLQALQETQLEVRQYEYSSLVQIQGWSDVPRGTPMFESLLAFENYPEMETMWTSTDTIEIREVEGFDRTNFPLTVNVAVFDEMHIRIAYDDRLYDDSTVARLAEHFKALLSAVATNPQCRLADLTMLTEHEAAELAAWNKTARDYPTDVTLADLFEQQVAATPEAIAIVCDEQQLSYAALNKRANQLAHYLQGRGVGPNTPVGICLERSIDLVVAIYGVIKAGGAYVPLDPEYPAERLAHMLEDAGISLLLSALL